MFEHASLLTVGRAHGATRSSSSPPKPSGGTSEVAHRGDTFINQPSPWASKDTPDDHLGAPGAMWAAGAGVVPILLAYILLWYCNNQVEIYYYTIASIKDIKFSLCFDGISGRTKNGLIYLC